MLATKRIKKRPQKLKIIKSIKALTKNTYNT